MEEPPPGIRNDSSEGQAASGLSDESVRRAVRAALPRHALGPRRWRILYLVPLLGITVTANVLIVTADLPLLGLLGVSLLLGHSLAGSMFLAHEIAHGAMALPRPVRAAAQYLAGLPFLLPPALWLTWHNHVHHGNANVPYVDPDNLGTSMQFGTTWRYRALWRLIPGSGHWSGVFFFVVGFSLEVQRALWWHSRAPSFSGLRRGRVMAESLIMLVAWIVYGSLIGATAAIFAILLPMAIANFTVISYIVTNHMLRPQAERPRILESTMSLSVRKIFDWLHFHFSHHVEHHLFPATPSSSLPLVRRALLQLFPEAYLAPPHWKALAVFWKTPRLYGARNDLVDPFGGRSVPLALIEEVLRGAPLGSLRATPPSTSARAA